MNLKKKVFYFVVSILTVSTVFIGYSCTSDEYDFMDNSSESGLTVMKSTQTLKQRDCRDLLLDSVAESDEFLDNVLEAKLVMSKYCVYVNSLSAIDRDELKYNINDDEYLENFVNKANMLHDMQELIVRRRNLLANAQFGKLDEQEKMELMATFFDSSNRVLLKDRGETLYSNCWEAYQSEQNRAESKASLAMLGCLCLIESGPGACLCALAVLEKLDDDLQNAKRNFNDCQERMDDKHGN